MKLNEEEWQLSNILYSNAALLIAENEKELRKLVSEFNEVCKRTKLGVNAEKCKVLVVEREGESRCEVDVKECL